MFGGMALLYSVNWHIFVRLDGALNGAGNEKWHTSNLNQILRIEKYIGDAFLQKTYTTDFLT